MGEMIALTRRALLLSTIGLGAAAGAAVLPRLARPTGAEPVDLEAMLPPRLGTWLAIPDVTPVLPDEAGERSIADAYDGWIARVYRRPDGKAVMLVVAYGSSTSRTLAVHRPETCYAAQGFTVSDSVERPVSSRYGTILTRQMTARREDRVEPVLFWMTVAGRQSGFGIDQNVALLRAAWIGEAPDAFLIRASTVEPDGMRLVRTFVADLLAASPVPTRIRFGLNRP